MGVNSSQMLSQRAQPMISACLASLHKERAKSESKAEPREPMLFHRLVAILARQQRSWSQSGVTTRQGGQGNGLRELEAHLQHGIDHRDGLLVVGVALNLQRSLLEPLLSSFFD